MTTSIEVGGRTLVVETGVRIPCQVGMATLIGFNEDEYPVKHGNCYSLPAGWPTLEESGLIKVVNLYAENARELRRRGFVDLEATVYWRSDPQPFSTRAYAVVTDERITDWLSPELCTICVPEALCTFLGQPPKPPPEGSYVIKRDTMNIRVTPIKPWIQPT